MEKLISVIVPVYNAEKTIKRCIESLVNQTYKNIEIILVDDGSTDESGEICDNYVKKYANITKYYKENGGLSTARNFGILHAEGEYISFVDADDFIEPDAYDKVREVIIEKNPDCIDFGWKYINDAGEVSYNLNGLAKEKILDRQSIENDILPPLLNLKKDNKNFVYDFVTNKIFKQSIIRTEMVYFDENRRTWEDRLFLVEYLKYCNSYYSMNKYFHNYVSVPNSLSRQYDLQYFDIILQNYKKYHEWFADMYEFNTQYTYDYWCKSIENMVLRSLKEKKNREAIRRNINRALSQPQVVLWYGNRKAADDFEEITSKLITEGNVEEVIKIYENYVRKQMKQEIQNVIKTKIYYLLRKVIKQ